nr:unnamed protein product [Digitaria exilis]
MGTSYVAAGNVGREVLVVTGSSAAAQRRPAAAGAIHVQHRRCRRAVWRRRGEDKTIAFLKREGGSVENKTYVLSHLQMIIKTLTAILSLLLEPFGVYCEGEFNLRCGYPYFAAVLNFSQYWALYCLVAWYTATKDELAPIKPLAKFLSFKSIVFLTWWQGVVIAILYALGLLRSSLAQSLELKSSIQNFIICIEVFILLD